MSSMNTGWGNNTNDYTTISRMFCDTFYTTHDTRFDHLADLYRNDSKITYNGVEYIGFKRLFNQLSSENITSIRHTNLQYVGQPAGKNALLINVSGNITINNFDLSTKKFNETFVLKKFGYRYYIINHIFTIGSGYY